MPKIVKKASRLEVIKVNDKLKEVLNILENGLCAYKDDHSDESVAKEVGCTTASVSGVRREIFGKLFIKKAAEHVDELTRLTENLTTCYHTLKDRHNKLVLLLALNKVVDCKHLEIK